MDKFGGNRGIATLSLSDVDVILMLKIDHEGRLVCSYVDFAWRSDLV